MERRVAKPKSKAKTRHEIACEYGIDRKTFYRWLKRTDLKISKGLICPAEVELIYNTFGNPDLINDHEVRTQ